MPNTTTPVASSDADRLRRIEQLHVELLDGIRLVGAFAMQAAEDGTLTRPAQRDAAMRITFDMAREALQAYEAADLNALTDRQVVEHMAHLGYSLGRVLDELGERSA